MADALAVTISLQSGTKRDHESPREGQRSTQTTEQTQYLLQCLTVSLLNTPCNIFENIKKAFRNRTQEITPIQVTFPLS